MKQVSKEGFVIRITEERFGYDAITNFENLVASKGDLIKMAFGILDLPMEWEEDDLVIRWFANWNVERPDIALKFVSAMMDLAGKVRRCRADPLPMDNPRYSFRSFLYYLGFSGPEYKELRAVLLLRLSGSSAHRFPPKPLIKESMVFTLK